MEVRLKSWIVILFSLVICTTSQAASIVCAGSYMGYKVILKTKSAGTHVKGPINVTLTAPDGSQQNAAMAVTSSDVRPGKYIHCIGGGKEVSGNLQAEFDAGTGLYSGLLNAQAVGGNAQVPVTCQMKGSRTMLAPALALDEDFQSEF